MISAQNHRPPLNGSKRLILVALACLPSLFASCELFKKAQTTPGADKTKDELDPIQGKRVYDPVTGTWVTVEEVVMEKMDTILWKEVTTTTYPPITSDESAVLPANPNQSLGKKEHNSELLSAYNVAFVLPFMTDRFNAADPAIYENSYWALHFYAGSKMALDLLSQEGTRLNVSAIDSRASEQTVTQLTKTNKELAAAHLIIGPYRRDNVPILARYAKEKDIVLVSPQSSASNAAGEDNENYVQVNPSLESHCQSIMRHALEHHAPTNIVLVSRDKDNEKSRLDYFQDEYKRWAKNVNVAPLQELIITDQSVSLDRVDVLPFIRISDTTVFILPNWEENFVYSMLRKIDLSKDQFDNIIVYGMPQWRDFEKIDFDYYDKLNVHISVSSFVDPLSPEIRLFRQNFYDRFGALPREEAYLGYDLTLYCGRMLKKHGTKFQYFLNEETQKTMHTRFQFEPVLRVGTTSGVELPRVLQFENKFVNILRFYNFQFQPVN